MPLACAGRRAVACTSLRDCAAACAEPYRQHLRCGEREREEKYRTEEKRREERYAE